MSLWRRLRPTGISHLSKRWHHSLLPGASAADHCSDGRPSFGLRREPLAGSNPRFFYPSVRYFAAPVQFQKSKQSEDDPKGPRLNEAIDARFVRLVTDEGHNVVPRQVALDQAMRLNLDLVEVQRTSNPPVCKIMDFHKEKFKQETKEKERAKSKSAVALRNGENKEVRFKAKTELKDLKIKAETVTRMMERGYRVKCTALPTGKEEEDLGGLLSRLLNLIEDVAVVESGPHVVDTRQAYVIVRHAKFATKKSGKKASKALENVSRVQSVVPDVVATSCSTTRDDTPLQEEEEWEHVQSNSETDGEVLFDQMEKDGQQLSDASSAASRQYEATGSSGFTRTDTFKNVLNLDAKGTHPAEYSNNSKPLHQKLSSSKATPDPLKSKVELKREQNDVSSTSRFVTSKPEPAVVESNRYAKQNEPKGRSNQMRSAERMPYQAPRNEYEGRVQFGPKQSQFNGSSNSPSPGYGPSRPAGPSDQNKRGDATMGRLGDPTFPSQKLGVLRAQNTAASGDQKHLEGAAVGKPNPPSSPTPKLGIFVASKTVSSVDQRNTGDAAGKPNPPSSSTPNYGIFSATKSGPSADQRNSGDAAIGKLRNPSQQTPSYGIFSTTKSANIGEQRRSGDATMGKPDTPDSPTPTYGIFSASGATVSSDKRYPGGIKGSVEENKSPSTDSPLNTSKSGAENKGRWGVFSREAPINQHRASDGERR